ncbi:hypothetical protein SE17_07710 [Kouleothrix aurantiaca]|uniref:Uncharacterized protein n=1 Tax=Kouleothrix aurantiaca TaxID=186479 RepID=A0A0P9DUJ8_9CHLR|nr:hypothetical protein SE17_07710 [Kouleothrix aurantiaca]
MNCSIYLIRNTANTADFRNAHFDIKDTLIRIDYPGGIIINTYGVDLAMLMIMLKSAHAFREGWICI